MVTTYEFNWLLKGWVAMLLVIFAATWAHLGYNVAFFLAGLQTIPKSVVDAAKVDGASGFSLFRWITFPLLSPVTFFLFIMNMVFSFFETFGIIHAVTQGGPGRYDHDHGLQNLRGRIRQHEDGLLRRPVGHPDGPGHLPDRAAVPVHGEEGVLLMSSLFSGQPRQEAPTRLGETRSSICSSSSRSALIGFPLYYGFVISTQSMDEVIQKPQRLLPSTHLVENYTKVWNRIHMGRLLINSAIVAVAVSLGKILISILSAFAIVYFNFRGKQIAFWMIFITLMLPVPVRIISTYQVVSDAWAGSIPMRG